MSRYIAVIDYDETEELYGAYFPDALGCTAMGVTEEEVVANATDALSEWVTDMVGDGQDVPEPRSYAQLLKSNEYGLGTGGMIATIPLYFESGRSVRANLSLDAGLLQSIDSEAAHLGITRSAFLAAAARDKLKRSA
ncbi:MAG: type II toxin-antitoxin system HicB family antitoxin [Candidatus Devosia phytovorans]|uniref:Type II toxin-antitoxin system HicB family antitoxin n=1 Tax=Candidatus Devosia phytovorans TaxID=3121372 RepID=A0AAJ5VWA0_9HYPH|nr:type II toxin-antitoxin system HicB family antitoxin [Devosia sp.]WEK05954.1 MAG: type II toxin-antitoxin system HicB family antitoxin [Devosia sp.]